MIDEIEFAMKTRIMKYGFYKECELLWKKALKERDKCSNIYTLIDLPIQLGSDH